MFKALPFLFVMAIGCDSLAPRDDATLRDPNHSGRVLHFDRNAVDVTKFRCYSYMDMCAIDYSMHRKPAAGWRLKLLNAKGMQLSGHVTTRHVGKDIDVGQATTTKFFHASATHIHLVEDSE